MKLSLKDIKIGDTLICINNDDLHGQLTILKEYKVISKYNVIGNYNCIVTICDDKTKGIYPLHNFITNIQFRKLKINKLYENIKGRYSKG